MTSRPETLMLSPGTSMPNSRLPVLIYRAALAGDGFGALFERNGWDGIWRDGIYDFDHYHSNAHEVLGIARGSATVRLGGEGGQAVEVHTGDVLVLPAGTGHRNLASSDDFEVVGAYPPGQVHYDICRERSPEAELRISKVPLPPADPVHGPDGPLLELWR